MKKLIYSVFLVTCLVLVISSTSVAQNNMGNVVNVQTWKMKWNENGSVAERDSLIAIYNSNVINKNEYILSHREYRHYFTASNRDYLVIEEYADLASMQKSFARTTELENAAWPDKMARDKFFDALGEYFEDWHGDALYTTNSSLSKN